MTWQDIFADLLRHYDAVCQMGTDTTDPAAWDWGWLGESVVLRRTLDGGEVTEEELPRVLAEAVLAAIPEREPLTRRAKIVPIDGEQ